MSGRKKIVKGAITFFLYLSIYTYMCIGGVGMALQVASHMTVASIPMWHSAAYGAVSVACINGVYFLGGKLDRILAAEEQSRKDRADLLAAWRR